jgi:hypothetical protein
MNRGAAARWLKRHGSLLLTLVGASAVSAAPETLKLNWKALPRIPDNVGFAAPFAGVSGGALIVAGGANFPGAMPWEGGTKVWYDSIFVLTTPDGSWRTNFKLPRPIGYGVSITTPGGVLCAGGSDSRQHFSDVVSTHLAGWQNPNEDPCCAAPAFGEQLWCDGRKCLLYRRRHRETGRYQRPEELLGPRP